MEGSPGKMTAGSESPAGFIEMFIKLHHGLKHLLPNLHASLSLPPETCMAMTTFPASPSFLSLLSHASSPH